MAARNLCLVLHLMVITCEINEDDHEVTYYKFDIRLSLHCNKGENAKLINIWQI